MDERMKRKQFHITQKDDQVLRELAIKKGKSEAEIVREAIREYAAKDEEARNPLLELAEIAESYVSDSPGDLSINHDQYLQEIYKNEKQ